MKSELKHLLENYAELERGVQKLVSEQCFSMCSFCTTACCCRADLCEEALESPFLRLLHRRNELESDRYGFLIETGCALKTGRPPICYEFFCDDLLGTLPNNLYRKMIRILGMLPTHAGQNAFGETHLVEIMRLEDLDGVAFQCLETQLQESFQALEILRAFFNEKTLPNDADRVLERIKLDEV